MFELRVRALEQLFVSSAWVISHDYSYVTEAVDLEIVESISLDTGIDGLIERLPDGVAIPENDQKSKVKSIIDYYKSLNKPIVFILKIEDSNGDQLSTRKEFFALLNHVYARSIANIKFCLY